jgi:protein-L-isoaspartate O-methyltransferase
MTRDLLHSAELKTLVRDAYGSIEADTSAVADKLYARELEGVPKSAIAQALGVNNHLRHADIRPGETVLDLGCGGGIDAVIAARRTGPEAPRERNGPPVEEARLLVMLGATSFETRTSRVLPTVTRLLSSFS